jgi:hypothetical protein
MPQPITLGAAQRRARRNAVIALLFAVLSLLFVLCSLFKGLAAVAAPVLAKNTMPAVIFLRPIHRLIWCVRSKYSCGLAMIVFEEPAKPLSTLDRRVRVRFLLR